MEYQTIKTFDNAMDAHLFRIELEVNDFEIRIIDEHIVTTVPFYSNAVGGIKVQIAYQQQDKLKTVLQGNKEDNVYLTTNKPQSTQTGTTVVDKSEVIAAINRLSEIMASNNGKEIVLQVGKDELDRVSAPAIINQIKKGSISF